MAEQTTTTSAEQRENLIKKIEEQARADLAALDPVDRCSVSIFLASDLCRGVLLGSTSERTPADNINAAGEIVKEIEKIIKRSCKTNKDIYNVFLLVLDYIDFITQNLKYKEIKQHKNG